MAPPRARHDALFRLRLGDGSEAVVLALLEHRSRVDRRTPLQPVRHALNVRAMETDGGLPPVIPIAFFHGRKPWTVPRPVQDMVRAPEGLEPLAQCFGRCAFHDLGRVEPRELSRSAEVRAPSRSARSARTSATPRPACWPPELRRRGSGATFRPAQSSKVSLPPGRIEAAPRRAGTDPEKVEEVMGTAAQIRMEQGIAEGKADTFLRQARRKFGRLPAARAEQVRGASPGRMDAWLDAPDIDSVFEGRTRH